MTHFEHFDGSAFQDEAESSAPPWSMAPPPPLVSAPVESELEFYTRRASEERQLATQAATPAAAAAHLYLAASYAARIARESARTAELGQLALSIP